VGPSGERVRYGRFDFIHTLTVPNYHLQCSHPQDLPFAHSAFANTFHAAAYGLETLGGFGFIPGHSISNVSAPISEVSLYAGATICGWVRIRLYVSQLSNLNTFKLIEAVADHKNSDIVDWPSNTMRMKVETTIVKVYEYFIKILIGLKDKPVEVQSHWRAVLVNFLQKNRINNLPPLTH